MEKIGRRIRSNRAIAPMMMFICIVIIGALLKIASSIVLPFTIAVLLTFVTYPLVKWLDKRRVPQFLSILLVITLLFAGLFMFGFILFTSGSNVIVAYYRFEHRITEIYLWIAQFFDLSFDATLSIWENLWGQLGIRTFIRNFAVSFSYISLNFVANAVLVALFILFIFLEANFFKEKLETAFGKRSARINQIGRDLMTQVVRYLTAKFFISLANGVIFAVAFHFIGLEFAIFWGLLQFMLNFIPNLGSIAAGAAICIFAIVQFWPDPVPVIMVVAVVLGVNLILCNIFDPKIVGARVGISPLVVLISLVFWGWIWGFAGMVLAVPMTVIIKIVCENIPILKPISILLGSRKSVNVKKAEQERIEREKAEQEKTET